MNRKLLLCRSDELFEQVEQAQLTRTGVNDLLRMRLRSLAKEAGFEPPVPRSTLGAHHWLFRLQAQLMRRHQSEVVVRHLDYRANDTGWTDCQLPRPWRLQDPAWWELAEAVVERCFHRWAWANHHARQSCKRWKRRAHADIALMQAAWANYVELKQTLEDLAARAALEKAA